jgi:hypothetical protein
LVTELFRAGIIGLLGNGHVTRTGMDFCKVLIHQALCSVYKVLETSSSGCYKVAANDV